MHNSSYAAATLQLLAKKTGICFFSASNIGWWCSFYVASLRWLFAAVDKHSKHSTVSRTLGYDDRILFDNYCCS